MIKKFIKVSHMGLIKSNSDEICLVFLVLDVILGQFWTIFNSFHTPTKMFWKRMKVENSFIPGFPPIDKLYERLDTQPHSH